MTTIMLMPWILLWHNRIIPAHLWVQCKVSQVWPWEGEKQRCQGNPQDNALPWEDQAKRNIPSVPCFQWQCSPTTQWHQMPWQSWWWCYPGRARWDRAWQSWFQQGRDDVSQRTGILPLRRENKLSAMFLRKPVCFAFRQSPFQTFSFPRDSASTSIPSDWLRMLMIGLPEHLDIG